MAGNKTKAILIKTSPKLKAETERCAVIEDENLSEYVRKAVEMRNKSILAELPHIDRKGFLESLQRIPDSVRRAYVEGDWDNCEDAYCDGCIYLSPNELEQNSIPGKPDHRCTKYNEKVAHNGHHPFILRIDGCSGKVFFEVRKRK